MRNVKFTVQAIFTDGTIKTRLFVTEKAVSNWANKMFLKDEGVTVYVYDFMGDDTPICTYHA